MTTAEAATFEQVIDQLTVLIDGGMFVDEREAAEKIRLALVQRKIEQVFSNPQFLADLERMRIDEAYADEVEERQLDNEIARIMNGTK